MLDNTINKSLLGISDYAISKHVHTYGFIDSLKISKFYRFNFFRKNETTNIRSLNYGSHTWQDYR